MRILGLTETCDLGALYCRLLSEGHDVRVAVSDPGAGGTMLGLVARVADWSEGLDWVGRDGVILFESVSVGFGARQDELRSEGYRVIGGTGWGDRLENDRAFAQALLAEIGFPTAPFREFDSPEEALAFLGQRPARYVVKFSGPQYASGDNFVGDARDGADVAAFIAAKAGSLGADARFVLMDHVDGVEIGVGAFFNGERFLRPACLDWEHKRFFAGDMGELTGEMGTVATFTGSDLLFDRTLQKLEPHLRGRGHLGWVNLNTIVNADGIWPLEFTCRFGYPGFAVLDPLQQTAWGDLFELMLDPSSTAFEAMPGFSTGIVVTTPPFPYSRKQIDEPVGLPIAFDQAFTPGDMDHVHLGEAGLGDVGLSGRQLVTSGLYGWTMVVTGTGETIARSRLAAYRRAAMIRVPRGRYRLDIGERLVAGDFERLVRMGLVGERGNGRAV